MKKILCVVLALVMAFSAATVAFAAETTTQEDKDLAQTLAEKGISQDFINAFNGQTLDIEKGDVAYMIDHGQLNGKTFLGLDLGFVYGTQYQFDWGMTNVKKSDMATLWNEMDQYMVSFLIPNYTNVDRMCTASNATAICNFVGHLLNAKYTNQTISFIAEGYSSGTRDYAMRKDFYQLISDRSGLTQAIINNWLTVVGYEFTCKKDGCGKTFTYNNNQIASQIDAYGGVKCPKCNKTQSITDYARTPVYEPLRRTESGTPFYRPFVVSALGVPLYNASGQDDGTALDYFFKNPAKEYLVPSELGAYIIKRVIEKGIDNGPIATLIGILHRLTTDYMGDVLDAIATLFTSKLADYNLTENDLKNYDVLFNMLASNYGSTASGHMTYIPFPAYRFATTNDTTEMFLYLMIYTNLLGKHLNNDSVINKYKRAIDNSNEINGTKKKHVKMFIDAMFFSKLTELSTNMQEIVEDNYRNIPSNWGWRFGNFWSDLIARFVAFFDSIFRTFRNGINLDIFG